METDSLRVQRLERWRQTPETKITDPDAAIRLIETVGIATLFPASSEIPNLYSAYMGEPEPPTFAEWDSPSGYVYGWRWALGKRAAAFYSAVVRKRPTWISWALFPALLRLRGELRAPDELYDAGEISRDAYRIAQALAEAGGALNTGELRSRAGFPTGKDQRAAYLKAVEELDTRLMLAKVFNTEDEDDLAMGHALVAIRHAEQVDQAERMTREGAMEQFLRTYLPHAVFVAPAPLAKHLGLAEAELRAGLERLATEKRVTTAALPGVKGVCYVWKEE
jgi:hypothetical protein